MPGAIIGVFVNSSQIILEVIMTTRKTRFDGKTIIEKYDEYKDYFNGDSGLAFPLALGITSTFTELILLFCCVTIKEWSYGMIPISLLLALMSIVGFIIPAFRYAFWKKQFKKLEAERRR